MGKSVALTKLLIKKKQQRKADCCFVASSLRSTKKNFVLVFQRRKINQNLQTSIY